MSVLWDALLGAFASTAYGSLLSAAAGIAIAVYLFIQRRSPQWLNFWMTVETSAAIDAELGRLLEQFKADRALFAVFHNGQLLPNGRHYLKLSVTNEVVRAGVSRTKRKNQNIPLSDLQPEIDRLKQETAFFEWNPPSIYRQHLLNAGIKGSIFVLVRDRQLTPVGILEFHYCHYSIWNRFSGLGWSWFRREFPLALDKQHLIEASYAIGELLSSTPWWRALLPK